MLYVSVCQIDFIVFGSFNVLLEWEVIENEQAKDAYPPRLAINATFDINENYMSLCHGVSFFSKSKTAYIHRHTFCAVFKNFG